MAPQGLDSCFALTLRSEGEQSVSHLSGFRAKGQAPFDGEALNPSMEALAHVQASPGAADLTTLVLSSPIAPLTQ